MAPVALARYESVQKYRTESVEKYADGSLRSR